MAYVQQTVQDTVLGLTNIYPSAPTSLQTMTITVRDGAINILWDGTAPTVSSGLLLTTTSLPLILRGLDIPRVRMIRNGSDNATVDIQFT